MSKVGTLTAFLKGMYVMEENGLRDYHAAKAVLSAGRKRDKTDQMIAVKTILKNYRVTVCEWQGDISVRRTTDSNGNTLACPQSWHLHSK